MFLNISKLDFPYVYSPPEKQIDHEMKKNLMSKSFIRLIPLNI